MYCDFKIRTSSLKEITVVLSELCDAAKEELRKIYGDDFIYPVAEEIIKAQQKAFIRLKSTDEAVGVFGLTDQGNKVGGIFLLTTDNLYKGNMTTLLRGAKKQIKEWEKDYDLLLDNCCKKNIHIQKWLELLGFKPSEEYQDDNFQIYYKGNPGLYSN